MKAKLILNEIKRSENSALGSIGVGNTRVTKFYDKLLQEWPDVVKELLPIHENVVNDYMIYVLEKCAEVLECDKRNLSYISYNDFSVTNPIKDFVMGLHNLYTRYDISPIQFNYAHEDGSESSTTINPIPKWGIATITKKIFDKFEPTKFSSNKSYYFIKTPPR